MKVAAHASKVVCIVCSASARKKVKDKKTFWRDYGPATPDSDHWSRESSWPRYFGMLIALAREADGKTDKVKLGRIFEPVGTGASKGGTDKV